MPPAKNLGSSTHRRVKHRESSKKRPVPRLTKATQAVVRQTHSLHEPASGLIAIFSGRLRVGLQLGSVDPDATSRKEKQDKEQESKPRLLLYQEKKPPQSSHTQIPGSYLHGRHTHKARERDLGFRFPGHCGLCTESHLSPTSQLANPCAFVLDGGQFPVKLASPSTSRQTKTTHPKHNAIATVLLSSQ